MTQELTPNTQITQENVGLLKAGDAVLCADGKIRSVESVDADRMVVWFTDGDAAGPSVLTYIGPDLGDGWIGWAGGDNPVPGMTVQWKARDGVSGKSYCAWGWEWSATDPDRDIIAFRPALSPPSEGEGAPVNSDEASLNARCDALAAAMTRPLAAQPSAGAQGEEWFGVTGAADATEALAVALFSYRVPGILMMDEDLHYYRAAAERALEAVATELDATPAQPSAGALGDVVGVDRDWMIKVIRERSLPQDAADMIIGAMRFAATPSQTDTGDVAALREALGECQKIFADYAEMHRHKLTQILTTAQRQDVHRKINRNRDMSDMCLAALSKPNAPGREG